MRVAATTDHDYADALRKQHPVTLLVVETTGAISPSFAALLRTVGRSARAKGAADHTHYGTARASPATFYAHHSAAISAAAVYADAHTILAEAATQCHLIACGRAFPAAAALRVAGA